MSDYPIASEASGASSPYAAPRNGDRVRLTYRDGLTVEGMWRDAAVVKDDGTVHSHTTGQVRRDILIRRADCCTCTPTQALDKIEQTLLGRRSRVVGSLSIGLRHTLESLADELAAIGAEESLLDELDALIRNASRGMCIHCGSYDGCPCDDMADQQSTGGY